MNASFNNNEVYELTVEGLEQKVLLMNEDNYDESGHSNYGLIIPIDEMGNLGNVLLTQTVRHSDDKLTINYLNSANDLIFAVNLDNTNQTMDFEYPYFDNGRIACGQATMDCLGDAYTNHGWISVWATVQTAFIPATAAALATACAAKNCL